MRSRSRAKSLFATLAVAGIALGAAGVASATTDTTTPEDTAATGTEAVSYTHLTLPTNREM